MTCSVLPTGKVTFSITNWYSYAYRQLLFAGMEFIAITERNMLMIKRMSFIALFLFLMRSLCAQDNYKNKIDVIPPAPNTASLGAYGGITPNLVTGAAAVNIPVYSLKVAGQPIDVSLSYNSGGFKVDEYCSSVGNGGWSLKAGGVISRIIYDVPDERGTWISPPSPIGGNNPEFNEFLKEGNSDVDYQKNTDVQPDQFSFSFMGYSGRFILDRTRKPVLLEFSSLRIEYTTAADDINLFKITTPDGTQYFFDKVERTKSTSNCSGHGGPNSPTGWYLTRILLVNGEEVTFEYVDQYLIYNSSTSETIYSNVENFQGCSSGESCPLLQPATCVNMFFSSSHLVSRINSRAGSISFEYVDRKDVYTGASLASGGQLLKKINVFDPSLQKIKSFSLDYQDVYGLHGSPYSGADEASRSFLVKLNEYDRNDVAVRNHQFEYNSLADVPARLSYSQDHWGFYNGKSNSTLIPLPPVFTDQMHYPAATANRNPDAGAAATGLLNKVIYPTGGFEQLAYEANTIYLEKAISNSPVDQGTYVQGDPQHPNTLITTTSTVTIGFDQEAVLTVSVPALTEEQLLEETHPSVLFTVADAAGGDALYNESKTTGTFVQLPLQLTAGHTYIIKSATRGIYIHGNANLNYIPGTYHMEYVNEPVGGVRVRSVTTAANSIEKPVTKFFYYGKLSSLNNSSGVAFTTATGSYIKQVSSRIDCALEFVTSICTKYAMYSNSLLNLFTTSGNIQYSCVTESLGGPNFENGGIQHTYTIAQDAPGLPLRGDAVSGCPYTNNSIYSGKETETLIFNKDLLPVEKRVIEYTDDPAQSKTFIAYAINLKYVLPPVTDLVWPTSDELECYNCTENRIFSRWIYKSRETVYKYDPTGNAYLAEQQDYEYNNPSHALPTQTAIYTSAGQKRVTTIKYPLDLVIVSNKTPFQSKLDLNSAIDGCEQVYNQALTTANASLGSLVGQANQIAGACYDTNPTKFELCKQASGYNNIMNQINAIVANKHTLATDRQTCIDNANAQYNQWILDYNTAIDQAINTATDEQQQALLTMQKRNIVSPVIQSRQYENAPANELSSTENRFKVWDANVVEPHYVYTGFKGNTPESVITFGAYDSKGNVLGYKERGKPNTSFVWGYTNSYPIASVANATAGEVFFDSFEETGTWNGVTPDNSKAHAGRMAGRIDGQQTLHSNKWLTVSLTQPTKYHYSGWVYSNGPSANIYLFMKRAGETGYYSYVDNVGTGVTNQWVFIEKDFDVPADVTRLNLRIDNNGGGSVWFDDLRLHPSAAFMTTYTYDPLIGVTSQTDANNVITYYEYDAFGRLKLIKDRDGNILKTLEYHYQTN